MSKKRDRNKSKDCQCPSCQNKSVKSNSGLAGNPFGINPSQLMGMLGNIDMGQIGNMLSSMNKDGFDLNNLNLGSMQNMMSGMNGSNGQNSVNGMNGMNNSQNNQDLSSIEKMMSGIDIKDNQGLSSIQDMISSMGNLQGTQNNMNNQDGRKIGEEKKYREQKSSNNKKNRNEHRNKENIADIQLDENIEMLMSIKKIVNSDRAEFLDKVIEFYNKGAFEDW